MTAWALLLAGVAAADGGQRMEAAREPVRAMPWLDVNWVGEGRVDGHPAFVWLDRNVFFWEDEDDRATYTLPAPAFRPDGHFGKYGLTCSLDRDRLTLRGTLHFVVKGDPITFPCCRFTLHPAARKP
jgi:hypothetical protein